MFKSIADIKGVLKNPLGEKKKDDRKLKYYTLEELRESLADNQRAFAEWDDLFKKRKAVNEPALLESAQWLLTRREINALKKELSKRGYDVS
jgi:hypothetical protein